MALRTLVLNKRIREKRERLTQLEATREELRSRETQLESDIEAAQTDEERAAVDEAIETFDREQNENNEQISAIEGEIADLERELEQDLYRLIVLYDKYFSHFDPPWAD